MVSSRAESLRVFNKLLDVGEANDLGGTGEPVGIVVVYPNQAFVKGFWAGDKADVVQALMDALESEARQ